MLHHFAEAAATVQRSSGGGCTTHHRRLPRSAAVAGAAAQRSSGGRRVVAQHANILPRLAAQRLGDLKKKCMGTAGPGEGQDGMGGPGREGEGQLLNSIVVEALALVCESEAKIECNLEFRIPQIKSIEISYAISHTICRRKRTMCCPKHTMSHTICNIRHRMWNLRHRKLHTTSYVGHPISHVAISYVPRIRYRTSISYVMTYDIVRVRYRTSRPTISYVYIGIIRYRTSDVRYRRLARIQMRMF